MRPDVTHFLQTRGRAPAGDIAQRLRELPTEAAPPYEWEEFQSRSHAIVARKGQHVRWWPHAAAAAGLAGLVASMAILGNGGPSGETRETPRSVQHVENAVVEDASAARLNREWLSHQPVEPVVVRVGSRIAVANLEDRIALFDDALTNGRLQGGASAEHMKVLQQERARLVSSLAQVRYAEALLADGS